MYCSSPILNPKHHYQRSDLLQADTTKCRATPEGFRNHFSGDVKYQFLVTLELEPGFSVWMLKEKTEASISAFMGGYKEEPSIDQIIAITDTLP